MTLVMALQAGDGIVMAADNRGSFGDPRGFMVVNDMRRKMFHLGERCGIGVSGPPDLASSLLMGLEEKLASRNATHVNEVTAVAREHFRSEYKEWFQDIMIERRPIIAFIICGYEPSGASRIYMVSSEFEYAPMLTDTGFHIMGLPLFATYLINRFYSSKAPSDRVIALGEYIVQETASQDPKVGGGASLAIITKEQGYREFTNDEIAAIRQKNESQVQGMRHYFTGGVS